MAAPPPDPPPDSETSNAAGASGAGPGPVEIGFFSFTEITDPALHRAYNEWHQLDHLPEQFPLDGVVWGQRWVRSPACRQLSTAPDPAFDAIHYVTCYLMTPPVRHALEGFKWLGADLRRRGRFFEQRRAVVSGPFTVTSAHAAERISISAAAVPFRPNLGAYVVLWEEPPEKQQRPGVAAPVGELLAIDGVAGVWEFTAHESGDEFGWHSLGHSALLCYLDQPPLDVAGALAEVLERHADPARTVKLAGPLETITPWQWDWFDGGG